MGKDNLNKRGLVTNGYSLPYNPDLTDRARVLRHHMTLAEEKLWTQFLKNQTLRFRAQKQIDNYIVDFYCAKLKLIIEVDGNIHDEIDRTEYDIERTKIFESYGLKVIRFRNDEIMNEFEEVCRKINELM